jgi:hypothetical protein
MVGDNPVGRMVANLTWNLLPRWKPNGLFSNRYDWQQLASYNLALSTPHAKLCDDKLQCEMNLYGEVKANVNGATSVVGSLSPTKDDPNYNLCVQGLARNLDFYSGLYEKGVVNKEKLRYEVFPFQLADAADLIAQLKDGRLTAFIAHVVEGKPTDASAAREFSMFKKHHRPRSGCRATPIQRNGQLRRGIGVVSPQQRGVVRFHG